MRMDRPSTRSRSQAVHFGTFRTSSVKVGTGGLAFTGTADGTAFADGPALDPAASGTSSSLGFSVS